MHTFVICEYIGNDNDGDDDNDLSGESACFTLYVKHTQSTRALGLRHYNMPYNKAYFIYRTARFSRAIQTAQMHVENGNLYNIGQSNVV